MSTKTYRIFCCGIKAHIITHNNKTNSFPILTSSKATISFKSISAPSNRPQLNQTSLRFLKSSPSDPPMKRQIAASSCNNANKKIRQEEDEEKADKMLKEAQAVLLDENLLYEVLRHVDEGQTLAKAACVSRQWRRTAHDERLWELICTKHDHRSPMQLRTVVLALGGFHKLYSSHLWPLLKPAAPSSSSASPAVSVWPCLPPAPSSVPPPGAARSKARWGKDEVNLSLSLLSIKYFEKMSFNNRSK